MFVIRFSSCEGSFEHSSLYFFFQELFLTYRKSGMGGVGQVWVFVERSGQMTKLPEFPHRPVTRMIVKDHEHIQKRKT